MELILLENFPGNFFTIQGMYWSEHQPDGWNQIKGMMKGGNFANDDINRQIFIKNAA